jgi:hypothetical protein
MEIFGKHIFGNDAKAWLKLCKEQKREWILKHTKQSNENLIDEFINNPNISKECKCLDCGKNKVNEPNGISKEVATVIEPVETGADSVGDSVKRQPKSKRRKG